MSAVGNTLFRPDRRSLHEWEPRRMEIAHLRSTVWNARLLPSVAIPLTAPSPLAIRMTSGQARSVALSFSCGEPTRRRCIERGLYLAFVVGPRTRCLSSLPTRSVPSRRAQIRTMPVSTLDNGHDRSSPRLVQAIAERLLWPVQRCEH